MCIGQPRGSTSDVVVGWAEDMGGAALVNEPKMRQRES